MPKEAKFETPIITIDGPSGTGKGTISQLLARKLGWHYLDSGALYRVLALAALKKQLDLTQEDEVAALAIDLPAEFLDDPRSFRSLLNGEDVTDALRAEDCSKAASMIAALPKVRAALLERQRDFHKAPGLVTDGRDMGTIVFPNAALKIFLDASVKERAQRRYKQLQSLGISGSIDAILAELNVRDQRDRTRAVAPLVPAADAVIIDTTGLAIDQVMGKVNSALAKKYLGGFYPK